MLLESPGRDGHGESADAAPANKVIVCECGRRHTVGTAGGNGGERRDASGNDSTVTGRCAAKFANAGVAVGAIILMRQVGSENDIGSWEKP